MTKTFDYFDYSIGKKENVHSFPKTTWPNIHRTQTIAFISETLETFRAS